MEKKQVYIAIDLKSFYASVECVERGLDPLTANLVVADSSRTEKTICLAVSPSLKSYGISGRARLFEVVQKVGEVNRQRKMRQPDGMLKGSSIYDPELREHPEMEVDYLVAPPRMALYMDYSTRIYQVYLKYFAPEDMHTYSIDEIMACATDYMSAYGITAAELAAKIIRDVYETTGITATAGIGTNLYLCKVAMDIVAKHVEPDENGVRIAQLDGPQAPYGFLESWSRICQETGSQRDVYHGRCCQMLPWKKRRISQRGSSVRTVRGQCGASY